MSAPDPAAAAPSHRGRWADRGWYLAVEYGVLARERFLTRLPKLRGWGRFQELLEPGGAILYRNLFREAEIPAAWELLTALRPWQDQLVCTLEGEHVPVKLVQDVLWCAGFLRAERPCRGGDKTGAAGCEGARVLLAPARWEEQDAQQRHVMTFARVDEDGQLCFDRAGLAAFAGAGAMARACPGSPARDPEAFAAAFSDVSVRSLDWPLIASLGPELEKRLGRKALEAEHGFVLRKGHPDLDAHAPLELRARGEDVEVRLASPEALSGPSIASHVRLPAAVRKVLRDGHRLRAVRIHEDFVRLTGGHYEAEQRFVISTRVRLEPTDRARQFEGYRLSTVPRATPEYQAWVDRVRAALP